MSLKAITLMRIIEVNGRFNMGLLFSALRPLLLVFVVGVFVRGYDETFGIADAIANVLFCGAVFFFLQEIMRASSYLHTRQTILYLPNTNYLSVILSSVFAAIFIFFPIFVACFFIFALLDIDINFFKLVEAIIYTLIFGTCYLVMVSFFCFNNLIVQQFVNFVPLIALFTSCVFYPYSSIPDQYQYVFLFNPIVHLIEMTRESILYDQDFSHIDINYVLFFSLMMLCFSVIGYVSNVKR